MLRVINHHPLELGLWEGMLQNGNRETLFLYSLYVSVIVNLFLIIYPINEIKLYAIFSPFVF